jgi:predicted alpha/beta superfamily hydrolase
MKSSVLFAIALTTPLVLTCQDVILAQPEGEDIVIGQSIEMPSKIYGKNIRLSVVLPSDYEKSKEKYPVLYSVQTYFLHIAGSVEHLSRGQIPKMIYVHLENYDSGDLIPTPISSRPESGGADRFISFFKDELIPFMDSNYRTQPFRTILSGSWGGVFCLYALMTQPEVFNGYIAATPWFIYDGDEQYMLSHAEDWLSERQFAKNFLFMAMSNDPDPGLHESFDAFSALLYSRPKEGLRFHHVTWMEEDHWSISHKALYNGLKWIYEDWREIPESVLNDGASGLRRYRSELAELYGYDIGINPPSLRMYCSRLRREEKYEQAIELHKYQIELSPTSPLSYEGLGRTYEAIGDLELALESFETALDLAKKQSVSDLARFEDRIERVLQKKNSPK